MQEIPFHVPLIDEREIEGVIAALRSRWLTTGPLSAEFERKFAAYLRVPFAATVSSGTAALHLALRVCGVGPEDEVITTPYAFVAVSEAILNLGARAVFADIDPKTLNIDPERVAEAVTSRTRAIVPVHIAGYPCEMGRLSEIAGRHGLALVDDAAHALPAEFEGRSIGSIGSLTAFSFYATKNLTTGEGGMVTTNDEAAIEKIKLLRLHGISSDSWTRHASGAPSWHYEVVDRGYKYNLTDIQSAMGLAQLARLDEMDRIRRDHARRFRQALADLPLVLPAAENERHRSSLHLFIVRVDTQSTSWTRDALFDRLQREGIHASVHFIPVHLHPYYRRLGFRRGMFPHAEAAFDQALSLPFYPAMPDASVSRLLARLRRLLLEERP